MVGNSVEPSGLRQWVHMPLDDQIPYIPATIFLYSLGYYLPLLLVFLIIRGYGNFLGYCLIVLIGGGTNLLIFLLIPIGIEVPTINHLYELAGDYPYPVWAIGGDTISYWLHAQILAIDSPNNTIPSLHVNYSVVMALVAKRDNSRLAGLLSFCAVGIMITIATTKQHYLLDGFAGAIVGYLAYSLVFSEWFQTKWVQSFPSFSPAFNAPASRNG